MIVNLRPTQQIFNILRLACGQGKAVSPLAGLPGDLLLEIASYLDYREEVLDLTLTCSRLFSSLVPMLYSSVILSGEAQITTTLGMLSRRPDIARHVQKLIVRPCLQGTRGTYHGDGYVVSSAVRQVARFLDALNTFVWEGEEIPPYDDMWFALRMSCPQLKNIATTIGSWPLSPSSHLLDFVGLRSFSLTLKFPFYADHVWPAQEELPACQNLWDMLVRRCPNLEELSIQGTYALSADAHLLALGHWPNLRKLTLGDVAVDWQAPTSTAEKRPFIDFLENHCSLESLCVSRHALPHTQLSTLDPGALPNLAHFSGTLEQLQAVPHLHSSITSIEFREPIMMRDITPLTVGGVLQDFKALAELKITFSLHTMYDSSSLLRSLVSACPRLRHLELTCAHKPSFQLESFSKSIRNLPRLRSLVLTIVKFPGDESLSSGATRIARANPRLHHFAITLIPPTLPVPLPFSPLHFRLPMPPVHEAGVYTLSCDHHGLPVRLAVRERRVWMWGLARSSKRYTADLRPGKARKGWAALMVDQSPAGEEMRLLLFTCLLVALAVWGFAAAGGWIAVV